MSCTIVSLLTCRLYKVLNYYKNDFSKLGEEKFINDLIFTSRSGITSQVIVIDANTRFNILL